MEDKISRFKITYELSENAAHQSALNAGCTDDKTAKLTAIGIRERSRFKQILKPNSTQHLRYQQNGYVVVDIEVA